jgi:hemoglobin-like flavoprotein
MSPDQVKLVQDSFAKVQPIALQATELFYGRLFEIAPEVRALFPADMAKQKEKLMAILSTAVTNLHQIEKIVPAVQELGRRHAGYGVQNAHYASVGEALIWALDQGLGPMFTAGIKDAWIAAYATLATLMKDAALAPPASQAAE